MLRPNPLTPKLRMAFIGLVILGGLVPLFVSDYASYQITTALALSLIHI